MCCQVEKFWQRALILSLKNISSLMNLFLNSILKLNLPFLLLLNSLKLMTSKPSQWKSLTRSSFLVEEMEQSSSETLIISEFTKLWSSKDGKMETWVLAHFPKKMGYFLPVEGMGLFLCGRTNKFKSRALINYWKEQQTWKRLKEVEKTANISK